MKPLLLSAALAAVALPLLNACANPSHATEAGDLRDRLSALPGVESATLDYTEPITLDSGKLTLRVKMAPDADADAIVKVIETTYDAFADTHRDEEGDLDIVVGDDRIHLRSFESDAEVDAVAAQARAALPVLDGHAVKVDLNTQWVTEEPHVETVFRVAVETPGVDSLLTTVADLEQRHADLSDASWVIQTGGEYGWQLSTDQGFPDEEQLDLFDELRADLPRGAVVWLDSDESTSVQLPDGTPPAVASTLVGRHLELLGGVEKAFYDVQSGPDLIATFAFADCYFDTGAAGALIEKDHAAACKTVEHVDPE